MIEITREQLQILAPNARARVIDPLVFPLNKTLPEFGIDTPLRVAAFLTQAAHETAGFRTLVEYGSGDGDDADAFDDYLTNNYDRRTDLGNTPELDGDGERYRGRGIFQLTGRDNYRRYGKRLGLDLLAHPELAATPAIAVRAACLFWNDKGLNRYADHQDFVGMTRRINGGLNGLEDRRRYYARARGIWSVEADAEADPPPDDPAPLAPSQHVKQARPGGLFSWLKFRR